MIKIEKSKHNKSQLTAPMPSLTSLNSYAKKTITTLLSLHKKIEASGKKEIIATCLFSQKKIIDSLINEVSKGNAIIGLTLLRGMIITGMKFDRFFDYTTPYIDNRGYEKIQELTYLENIIPLMKKYRTLEKANTVIPFVLHLPNINKLPFSPELFDILNTQKQDSLNFQKELFTRALEDYDISDTTLKEPIKSAIKMAAFKGYSSAALAYISLLEKEKKLKEGTSLTFLNSIKFNKFSSEEDRALAISKLQKLNNISLNKRFKKSRTISL